MFIIIEIVVLSVNLINNGKTINGEKTSHNGVNYLPGFFGKGFVLLTLAHLTVPRFS